MSKKSMAQLGPVLQSALSGDQSALRAEWISHIVQRGSNRRIGQAELDVQCREVLADLLEAAPNLGADLDVQLPVFSRLRNSLGNISRSRALGGFSPTETVFFVLSLKQPLVSRARTEWKGAALDDEQVWQITDLIDRLGVYTAEVFQKSREEVIVRQQQEIAELSTPVVKLWEGVLALPLIGTLDSARTQVVMENLLQGIVEQEADIAIIDITGVPTVDTLVAQHLLKTIAAARLMGADCIISGIRPQIAQTMVHLGVDLNVVSKATLADAFALALRRIGRAVTQAPSRAALV